MRIYDPKTYELKVEVIEGFICLKKFRNAVNSVIVIFSSLIIRYFFFNIFQIVFYDK